jgi:excisionase family DNA binding protein
VAAVLAGTTGKYESIHPADRRLVGLDGAADMLALSRSKVHLMVHEGEFDTVRIGRRLLITVESIDTYIERKRYEQS